MRKYWGGIDGNVSCPMWFMAENFTFSIDKRLKMIETNDF